MNALAHYEKGITGDSKVSTFVPIVHVHVCECENAFVRV